MDSRLEDEIFPTDFQSEFPEFIMILIFTFLRSIVIVIKCSDVRNHFFIEEA
jgi:hypothetical protein